MYRSRKFYLIQWGIASMIAVFLSGPVAAQGSPLNKDSVAIYLSFDDGPILASWYLLSFVQTDSIPVNVMLVGRLAFLTTAGKKMLLAYRNNPLVEINNHSFSHARKKYKSFYSHPDKVIADILLNEDTLQLKNKILRFPGRNVWRVNGRKRDDLADAAKAADSLVKRGYRIFGWDLEWRYDTAKRSFLTAYQMFSSIIYIAQHKKSFIPEHIVILCHDQMLEDKQARIELGLFIKKVKLIDNWHFTKLQNYPVQE